MILKHHEHTSFDSDLEQLLDTLSKQHTMTINCTQAAIEQSMREVVIYVGRELLKHRVLKRIKKQYHHHNENSKEQVSA